MSSHGDDDLGPELEQAIDRAISAVLAEHGQMVNRWLAMVEVVDTEGDRGMWTFTADGMKRWDALGMLQYGLIAEQTRDIEEGSGG